MRRRKREDMFWINRLTECSCIMHPSPAALAHKGNAGPACKSFITTGLFTPSVRGDQCHAEAKTDGGGGRQSAAILHFSPRQRNVEICVIDVKRQNMDKQQFFQQSYNSETPNTQVWKPVYESFTFTSVLYAKDIVIKSQTGGIGRTEWTTSNGSWLAPPGHFVRQVWLIFSQRSDSAGRHASIHIIQA